MKDTRSVLDSVRDTIDPQGNLLVVWIGSGEDILRCSQANMDQADLAKMIEGLKANLIASQLKG